MSESKAVIERYVAALLDGDVEAIRASFADDAVWTLDGDLPISGVWRGRDAIVDDFLGKAIAYYEPGSVSIEVTSLVADGELVAMEWTSRARTAAGEAYENHCIGMFTVRDGRIQAVREYMDTQHAARAFAAVQGAG
jgi:uncharacterized protein (TIGR02246 family)